MFHLIRNDGHCITNCKLKSASIYYVLQHGIENILSESWPHHCFINIASNCRFWTYLQGKNRFSDAQIVLFNIYVMCSFLELQQKEETKITIHENERNFGDAYLLDNRY